MNTVSKKNKPVVVICAPTACGKTAFAELLFASDADSPFAGKAEIISADSMQVYRGFNIGTAKPDANLLKKLPHHLIDICDPRGSFGAGDFVRATLKACADIYGREKLPVIVGGTGFYIRNFMYGLPPTPRADMTLREQIARRMEREGAQKLWEELSSLDPVSAQKIHIHDEYRIKRALEVCTASGQPLSAFSVAPKPRGGFRFLILSLQRSRAELYERIDKRVDLMFEQGLCDEVRSLVASGCRAEDSAMQAIGYREFFTDKGALQSDTDVVKERIKKDSRAYAKRQQTFFKAFSDACTLKAEDVQGGIKKIGEFISGTA
ncbi:tRNA (adenosine(37)-N6)-dimethylallyltransferase MiaA [Treponema sp. OMZ 840]|uniref:tRNA (adenosine(37)-N6)-dimethylallyltransferase MiaA n=1 Tax=Treponema sp. OMZ 840 TaxID=244313 RepID=UPI003D8D9B7B